MAENKIVTLEQLRDLAEKGKLDTLSRINTLAESVIPLLESAQHNGITVTLPAENWKSRSQIVKDKFFYLTANTGILHVPIRITS